MTARMPDPTDPDAWHYDWVAVQRACDGWPIGRPLTWAELNVAVHRLRTDEIESAVIAQSCGISLRALERLLNAQRALRRRRREAA